MRDENMDLPLRVSRPERNEFIRNLAKGNDIIEAINLSSEVKYPILEQ